MTDEEKESQREGKERAKSEPIFLGTLAIRVKHEELAAIPNPDPIFRPQERKARKPL